MRGTGSAAFAEHGQALLRTPVERHESSASCARNRGNRYSCLRETPLGPRCTGCVSRSLRSQQQLLRRGAS